ncbi:MAG TPA: GNAT family N-acetyltransferase, partial [Polyangia bacterium]
SEGIVGAATRRFHREAARRLAARGWARVYVLHVAGAPRAALYGFAHGDRFAFYQAGYDPEWRQRSVGTVLLGHVVRECFAERRREYDFLRGSEPYKLKWANGWRETVRLRARDSSLRALLHDAGRTAYWRLREAGKRALPGPALDWARRARKRVSR